MTCSALWLKCVNYRIKSLEDNIHTECVIIIICYNYILSILRVQRAGVKSIVLANQWLITICCYVLWQENGTFKKLNNILLL